MRGLAVPVVFLFAVLPTASAVSPAAPTDLTGTVDPAAGTIELAWSAPGTGTYTYSIYRGPIHLADTTSTTITDRSPFPGLNTYTVTAIESGDESSAALLVVPTVPICGATPSISRTDALIVSPIDSCQARTSCPPAGLGVLNQGEAVRTANCAITPCEPIIVWILPPDVRIREECLPHDLASGGQSFEFQVVS